MKRIRRFLDGTLGKWSRHVAFIFVRAYYALFYNVSCSGKHLLQDLPGGLILSSHVSRHDGPLVIAMLYSTRRVRPAVRWDEYYNRAQWLAMVIINAIPMSSPKHWPPERRAQQKDRALRAMQRVIGNGGFVLLFPQGYVRTTPREVIQPHFSGAYETVKAVPEAPVLLVRLQGLGRYDAPKHDLFWSWLGITRGRRHVEMTIERVEAGLDTSVGLAAFNADLEARFNAPPLWPLIEGAAPVTDETR